jgi:hypothetical protein
MCIHIQIHCWSNENWAFCSNRGALVPIKLIIVEITMSSTIDTNMIFVGVKKILSLSKSSYLLNIDYIQDSLRIDK